MKTKQKNENRARFNAADAFILLVLLAVVLALVYFIFFADRVSLDSLHEDGKRCTVIYTLEIAAVDTDLLDGSGRLPIAKGEGLYHIDGSFSLGQVVTVSEGKPYMAPTSLTDSKGNLIYAEHPTQKTFTVTVRAEAVLVDGVYQVEGKTLRVGDRFVMATPFFTATASCKAIEEE